jgi:hypothetical protein
VPVQQTENTGALLGRMVIQVASLVLTVDNLENRLTQVYQLTASTRGYLSELNVNAAERGPRATFVLKVPPDQLDSTLVALRQMALVVRDQKLGSEDVTAEFSDLEQIVANLESSEQQYREIMKRMTQPEDIVKIFNELTRIRGEIEVLKGRMNRLSRLAAMATINVEMLQEIQVTPTPTPMPRPTATPTPRWSAGAEFDAASTVLARRSESVMTQLIWFAVGTLPFVLVGLLLLVMLWPLLRMVARRITVRKP